MSDDQWEPSDPVEVPECPKHPGARHLFGTECDAMAEGERVATTRISKQVLPLLDDIVCDYQCGNGTRPDGSFGWICGCGNVETVERIRKALDKDQPPLSPDGPDWTLYRAVADRAERAERVVHAAEAFTNAWQVDDWPGPEGDKQAIFDAVAEWKKARDVG